MEFELYKVQEDEDDFLVFLGYDEAADWLALCADTAKLSLIKVQIIEEIEIDGRY